jgi:hypothetical protein
VLRRGWLRAAQRAQAARAGLAGHIATIVRRHNGPGGALTRPRPTASMATWVMLMLAGYLLLYYV